MSLFQILSVWITLASIVRFSSNAAHLPSNALETSDENIKIELIDVKCNKDENGMHVTVQFADPFDGIIYSHQYFSDPKCRYVSAGQNKQSYSFIVPYKGCGSKPTCSVCDSIDNILIIQQDEEVQGEFDAARKISCSRTGIDVEKKVYFKPFAVDMLDVVSVPTANGGVDCWMDIKRGTFPQLTSIGDVIKIGEALTVLVYLRDEQQQYDLSVRNCWAYDGEEFDDKQTSKVQLSDASGCSMKRKLFGSWQKTPETGSSGATLLLHNSLRAFKFPDESQIYLKCDIEICRGNCAEAICDADELNKVDCTVDPLNVKCIKQKLIGRPESSVGFTTASNKPLIGKSTITTRMPLLVTTKRPSFDISTTERLSYTSTPITDRAFETTQAPETTTFNDVITQNPFESVTSKSAFESFCNRYPTSKICNQRLTDDSDANFEIITYKPPKPFEPVEYQTTKIAPKPYPENETGPTTDSRVNKPRFICNEEYLDPRCPNPTPTNTPPTYLPPNTTTQITSRIETTSLPPTEHTTNQPITRQPYTNKPTESLYICVPGSNDVNCDNEAIQVTNSPTTNKHTETTTIIPIRNQVTTKKPICFPGSTDGCQKVTTNTLNLKPKPDPKLSSTSNSPIEPRQGIPTTDRPPICYPGSLDSRCSKSITKKPINSASSKLFEDKIPVFVSPVCYPGSTDPRCPKVRTTTKNIPKNTSNTRITSTSPATVTSKASSSTNLPPVSIQPNTLSTITTEATSTEIPTSTPFRIIVTSNPTLQPKTIISTTQPAETTTEKENPTTENVSTKTKLSSTFAPRCYLGSLDPRCLQTTVRAESLVTTTQAVTDIATTTTNAPRFSTTNIRRCYPGSLDPQCLVATTKTTLRTPTQFTTISPVTSTALPDGAIATRPPICYPGALDPRCTKSTPFIGVRQKFTTQTPNSPSIRTVPNINNAPRCSPGSLDPKCTQTTSIRANDVPTTSRPILSTAQAQFTCYPGSLDPRCSQRRNFNPLQCGLGLSLDPRCPNPTPTAQPATYLPPFNDPIKTTKPPIFRSKPTAPFKCVPNSLDPRCKIISSNSIGIVSDSGLKTTATYSPDSITSRAVLTSTTTSATTLPPSTEAQTLKFTSTTKPPFTFPTFRRISSSSQPINSITSRSLSTSSTTNPTTLPPSTEAQTPKFTSTTKAPPFTFPTFSTRRTYSSPQPFTTKPSTPSTTTENVLCYPGSTIEGCKSTFTTPSFCYPGSKDLRCPQLPPSFSTRQPAVYLPPYPDVRFNRIKRQTSTNIDDSNEVVKFSLSFKPYSFS